MVAGLAAVLLWRRRNTAGGISLALLMLSVTAWGLSVALKDVVPLLWAKIFWAKAEILGASCSSVFFLLFALEFQRQDNLLSRSRAWLLWLGPLLFALLAVSNEWHHLFWANLTIDPASGGLLEFSGPFYWVYLAYYYALRLLGSIVLIWAVVRFPDSYRAQTITIIAGALAPWARSLLDFFLSYGRPESLVSLEPHPGSYALAGAILAWGVLRYQLFDLVPLARSIVLENLHDAIFVLDPMRRVVDINRYAANIFGLTTGQVIGQPYETVQRKFPALVADFELPERGSREIYLPAPIGQYFSYRVDSVRDRHQRIQGWLVTLQNITGYKKSEQALLESEANLSALLEAVPLAMTISRMSDGCVVYANPAALELFEIDAQNYASTKAPGLYTQRKGRKALLRALEQGKVIRNLETTLRTPSGKEHWIVSSMRKIVFNGEDCVLGTQVDISRRKKLEENLRSSQAQLKVVFDYAGVGIRTLDKNGKYTFVNHYWAEMLRRGSVELIGKEETGFLYPNDVPFNQQKFEEVLGGEIDQYHLENRYRRPDGSYFWASLTATPILGMNGKPDSVVGFIIDITNRKQAEAALKATERRFREILENVHLLSVMLDSFGNITFCNSHILSVTGWQEEDLLGRNWFDALVPSEQSTKMEFMRAVQHGNIVSRHESYILSRNGEKRLISWSNILLKDIGEQPVGMASIGEDITENRQLYEAEREQRIFAQALKESSAVVTASLDFEETLNRILLNVGKVVPHDAANIALIKKGRVEIVRSNGYQRFGIGEEDLKSVKLSPRRVWNLKQMIETKQPIVIPDVREVSWWKNFAVTQWVRSYLGAPVIVKDEVVGFLSLDSSVPGFFNQDHAQRLESFSGQAAIAIENARLFEQSQHELEERRRAQQRLRRVNKRLQTQLAEIEALQAQLHEQAIRDSLTGLYDRRHMEETLSHEIARTLKDGRPLSVVMLDIDNLREANDRFGHSTGDVILKKLADMIQQTAHQADIVCRYGGEEFFIILPGISVEEAYEHAEKWRKTFAKTRFSWRRRDFWMTISVGIAGVPKNGRNSKTLFANVDKALYAAKQDGRNCVRLASSVGKNG